MTQKFSLRNLISNKFLNAILFVSLAGAGTLKAQCTTSVSASSTLICSGNTLTLSASAADSYTWSGGSNTSSLVVTPTITSNYSVATTDGLGCVSSASLTIVVDNTPTVTASVNTSTVCAGFPVIMTASGANTYTWTNGVINGSNYIPAISSNYTVTGTNSCGTSTAVVSVTVLALPVLSITASSPSICAGGTVNLNGTGALSYTWTPAITNNTPFSPNSTTTYTLAGADANGCVSQNTFTTISVINAPTITAVASNTSICAGQSVSLTANGASTYTWSNGVNNGSSFIPTTTSDYTVISTNACGSSSAVVSVTVFALPVLTITASSPSICGGGTVNLNGTGALTYTWTPSIPNNTPFSPTLTTTYTLAGTDANGCVSQNLTTNVAVTIAPSLTAVASETAACMGQTVSLTASGATTYTWSNGIANGAPFSPTSTADYTVTSINACGSSSAVVSVTIYALPTVTATASSPSICAGGTVSLNGTGAFTYTWTPNIVDNTPFSPTTTATYTLYGTDANGCVSLKSTTNIAVINAPTVTAVASKTSVCNGQTITLTANGASTYTWSNGVANAVSFTPTATSDYSVSSVNACGSSSAVVSVTVFALPTVTASVNTPSICSGGTVVLNATGAINYTWTPNAPNNASFTPAATANYSVIGTDANGCAAQAIVGVTVINTPSIVPIASSTAICVGSTATISAVGAANYSWTAQNFAGSSNSIIVVSPTVTTVYTLERANSTCTTSAVVTLVVNNLPTVTASPALTVCACTSSAIISATGGISYIWQPSSITSASVVVYPCSSTIYTVYASDAFCTNTATVSITANALPTIGISSSSPSVCIGSSVSLTANGASNYTWTSQPNASVYPNTAGIIVTPSITTLYTASGTNSLGCTSSAALAVVAHTVPVTMASVSPSILCTGGTATLNASGADTYSWITLGSTAPSITLSPAITATYVLIGYANNGCSSSTVVSVPVSTLQLGVSGNTTVCLGKVTTLVGTGGTGLAWTGLTPFNTINLTPTATAVYTLTGTDNNNCFLTKTVTVIVNPNPTITASASQSLICKGESVTLTATGTDDFVWGTSAGSATTSTVIVTPASVLNHIYDVTGTNQLGCSATTTVSVIVDACTGVNELTGYGASINIYPNPNNGRFTIKTNEAVTLTIINALGQLMTTISVDPATEFSVDGLAKGVYFVIGDANGFKISKKIIVE